MFTPEYEDFDEQFGAVIKVVGVGGGGGNAVNHMIANMIKNDAGSVIGESSFESAEHGSIIFYAVNTDVQALRKSHVQQTVQIGGATTRGLGAGANPNVGRKAAEDDQEEIRKMLEGADMVFIAAGMGGGTGTGAAPVIARVAKELGILTVAVVSKPFSFEGRKRMHFAEIGIKDLSQYVDSLIVIPNAKLQKVLPKNITLLDAFSVANDVLRNAVTGISDMITSPGLINVDFADVKTVMSEMGRAMMGSGVAKGPAGEGRAEKAAQDAVASPLLEDVDLAGARGVIVNVTAGFDLTLPEFEAVGAVIESFASEEATVIVGTALDPDMSDEIRVTIVATGIGDVNVNKDENIPPIPGKSRSMEDQQAADKQNDKWLLRKTEENRPTYAQPTSMGGYNAQPTPQRNPLDTPITERLNSLKKEMLFNPENFANKE